MALRYHGFVRRVARSFLDRHKYAPEHARFMSCEAVSTDLVKTEKRGEVFMIGLNSPGKRNAVSPAVAKELLKAFQQFEAEEGAKVAVLYGEGGVFCAGYDLSSLSKMDASSSSLLVKEPVQDIGAPMGPSRMFPSKPVIAAVEGYAVAGGLELACLCDLRVVDETAIMGVFCRRFGVPLIDGGTVRLPKLIGLSRALDLILTGRAVTAAEAKEYGLANRVVAAGTAVEEAVQLAKDISMFPQECMLTDRRSAYYSSFNAKNTLDAFQFEFENGMKVIAKESVKGAQSFVKGSGKHGSFNLDKKSKL
ncbi:probable enoyl-CoA hydratase [Haliotis rubra]|uniref:probable enoyl-CoA hydratase n=1 Tax=Haliotis rubra TaxID=36100 RepID=UPI001EE62077|nr:probable enoyl-CoA hydratase [Haliotis rubra]